MRKSIFTRLASMIAAATALALPVFTHSAGAQTSDEDGPQSLSNPESAFEAPRNGRSWHADVEATERGFRIGNPAAEASLIEFISYTCSHCATFAREGEGAMDLILLAPGHLNVEVRSVIRNPIDLTVSMLVQCGGPEDFKNRHRMFLLRQQSWIAKVSSAPQSQKELWARGTKEARISMASALDLDDMLANRGVSRAEITTCLSNDEAALALIRNGAADREDFAYTGTPSFALDGELLSDIHNWAALSPVIQERFRPKPEETSAF